MASLSIFNFGMLHLVDSIAKFGLYFVRFIHVTTISLLCLHKMFLMVSCCYSDSVIIVNYDLHCGTDPHEVKYFTNPVIELIDVRCRCTRLPVSILTV